MSEDDDWLDELVREIEAQNLKTDNPYALHLIQVLWPFAERGLLRRHAIERVWRLRHDAGIKMPDAFTATVQSAYNNHCEDSDVFIRRNANLKNALFYPVGRKGSGRWAVHRDRAETWLQQKKLEI
jgi:hypothetical protein